MINPDHSQTAQASAAQIPGVRLRTATAGLVLFLFACGATRSVQAQLNPPTSTDGYIARLLLNETPFPGERGWVSEANSQAAMLAILHVLNARIRHIPPGYTQEEVAAVRSQNILDVITAGGEKGQCDGFYRDAKGQPAMAQRVHDRIHHLLTISNRGAPGRFGRLIQYAQELATAYTRGGMPDADIYAAIHRIGPARVTGRAYSWMTGQDIYHPGGCFIRIPDDMRGLLGGNRFYTLQARE